MRLRGTLKVIGAHCEGEVGNVVIDGVGDVPGRTMAEKSEYLEHNMDHIR
ncbi:MAG: proline racemase family protein, partial [Gammaproteobacteria bacterium]|nr:proline racemase family protein [Gammaproteobacteria bacterium]